MRARGMTQAFSPMGRETFVTRLEWVDGWPVVEPLDAISGREPLVADGADGPGVDLRAHARERLERPGRRHAGHRGRRLDAGRRPAALPGPPPAAPGVLAVRRGRRRRRAQPAPRRAPPLRRRGRRRGGPRPRPGRPVLPDLGAPRSSPARSTLRIEARPADGLLRRARTSSTCSPATSSWPRSTAATSPRRPRRRSPAALWACTPCGAPSRSTRSATRAATRRRTSRCTSWRCPEEEPHDHDHPSARASASPRSRSSRR